MGEEQQWARSNNGKEQQGSNDGQGVTMGKEQEWRSNNG
jgi:hypothetical protein